MSLSSKHGFFFAREKASSRGLERLFLCIFCVCVCFCVCVFCRHFFGSFFLTQGETKPCVTIASLFSLNSHKNQHHVQPSRVLRHGNRRATGRTHRNDGASSRTLLFLFCFSLSREHHYKRSLLLLRCLEEEKNLDRHFLDRFFFYCCDDSFTTLRVRAVCCVQDQRALALRDHLHEYY